MIDQVAVNVTVEIGGKKFEQAYLTPMNRPRAIGEAVAILIDSEIVGYYEEARNLMPVRADG